MSLAATVAVLIAPLAASAASITTLRDKPDEWFSSDEGRRTLANVLSWQRPTGGWWKAYDVTKPNPEPTKQGRDGRSIFDNNATITEMQVLGRAFRLTRRPEYRAAFERALAATLDAQYANGGWPQEFPPPDDNYARFITFNDDAMVNVLRLLREVADGKPDFAFVDERTRERARAAFDKGIDCILNTQIRVDGKLTVWCAQHDDKTLAPAKARTYELPSLSGGESVGITLLLMEIERPSERVKQAVVASAAWYERSKLTGIREERRPDSTLSKGYDVVVIDDPAAPPLWCRFYDLETGKPFFCGRDGVKKSKLSEIEAERRSGYAWLRPWGTKVLEAYPAWAAKHGLPTAPAQAMR